MLHFHIITLFPESIEPYLKSSILGRAIKNKLIKISFYDPKDFAVGKHKRVDQRPYGGGPGMVLEPTAMLRAATKAMSRFNLDIKGTAKIFFSTDGAQFDESMAKKLARKNPVRARGRKRPASNGARNILLICGRYEGVDARVPKILKAKSVSVGPYVLTGGELPAATVVDAVARFVPGVLGKAESLERSRVSSPEVYTRPEILVWKGKKYRVPKILLSGHQARINEWKQKKPGK